MSLKQLAVKLDITKQSVREIEIRKKSSITLNSLEETANALDMKLVYGLVPKEGSLDRLIKQKAKKNSYSDCIQDFQYYEIRRSGEHKSKTQKSRKRKSCSYKKSNA